MLHMNNMPSSSSTWAWEVDYRYAPEYMQESQFVWNPKGDVRRSSQIGARKQDYFGYSSDQSSFSYSKSRISEGIKQVAPEIYGVNLLGQTFHPPVRRLPLQPYSCGTDPIMQVKQPVYENVQRSTFPRPMVSTPSSPPSRVKQMPRSKVSTDPNHLLKVTRKAVADETLKVLRAGSYTLPNGKEVDVSAKLKNALDRATCFSPDYYFLEEVESRFDRMVVEVTEETTLQACKRLYEETGGDVGCLSFSSGKNPGGGFLGGSGGQEESIARSSAYYLCVIKDAQLYEYNRSHKDPYHSDHLIVSPEVPVIREEMDPYTLREPWPLTVISAPAVNAGVVRSRNPGCISAEAEIHRRMRIRIRRILGAAVEHGVSRLVLGEYGCGALENNPRDVARYFKEELMSPGSPFACAFDRVVFAVHDDTGTQTCGRQRLPCYPDFMTEICPEGKPTVVTRE